MKNILVAGIPSAAIVVGMYLEKGLGTALVTGGILGVFWFFVRQIHKDCIE